MYQLASPCVTFEVKKNGIGGATQLRKDDKVNSNGFPCYYYYFLSP